MGIITLDSAVRAGDLFSDLAPEDEQKLDRTLEYETNPVIERLERKFKKLLDKPWRIYNGQMAEREDVFYNRSFKLLSTGFRKGISSRDIEQFALLMAKYQSEDNFFGKAGTFLSAAINISEEDSFKINTSHFSEPTNYLCYKNEKNVDITGDAYFRFAKYMKDGSVKVKGNVLGGIESFLNGSIEIFGNLGHHSRKHGSAVFSLAGYVREMNRCGKAIIHVHGDVYGDISPIHYGGEVHIDGDIDKIHDSEMRRYEKGFVQIPYKIFHKGKLILGHENGQNVINIPGRRVK